MKKISVCSSVLVFLFLFCSGALAGSYRFIYKMAPGQTWKAVLASQSQVENSADKNEHRHVVLYQISKGIRTGWIALEAEIEKSTSKSGGMNITAWTFRADMHKTGEIRNAEVLGVEIPEEYRENKNITPEMLEMMKNSYKMVADAWKNKVFWFPEFPERELRPGDEFDITRKFGQKGQAMSITSVGKETFILDQISQDLAYFTLKQRALTETQSNIGGSSQTKSFTKGEAIFDLRQGAWIEMSSKRLSRVDISGLQADSGAEKPEVTSVNKYTMERVN